MQIPLIYRRGRKKPWTSIPRINWGHPLASGLVSYCYDAGGVVIDLVTGQIAANISGTGTPLTRQTSSFGNGYKYPGTTSDAVQLPLNPNVANITTAAPFAIAVGVYQVAAPATQAEVIVLNDPALSFGFELQTFFNGVQYQLIFAGSVSGDERYVTAVNSLKIGQYQTILANVETGTSGSIYVDGALDGTFTGSPCVVTSTAIQLVYNSAQVNNAGVGVGGCNGFVPWVALRKRPYTASEAFQIHHDPYCFLIYPEDEMFAAWTGASTPSPPGPGPNFLTSLMPMMGVG